VFVRALIDSIGGSDRLGGYAVREELPLPSKPPYTAHLGNLSFDATEGDISDFFAECEVTNVRIVEDKLERKPKGFGYVEFGSVDGLKKALDLSGTQFQGRNIRVSVAEPRTCWMYIQLPIQETDILQPRTVLIRRICPIGPEGVLYLIFPVVARLTVADFASSMSVPMQVVSVDAPLRSATMARSATLTSGSARVRCPLLLGRVP
jgi:RNA recognition motif-containing protein